MSAALNSLRELAPDVAEFLESHYALRRSITAGFVKNMQVAKDGNSISISVPMNPAFLRRDTLKPKNNGLALAGDIAHNINDMLADSVTSDDSGVETKAVTMWIAGDCHQTYQAGQKLTKGRLGAVLKDMVESVLREVDLDSLTQRAKGSK